MVKDKSVELHGTGLNCAQSVLLSLEQYTGLDKNTAVAACVGLGGGAGCGEICGAASGAIIALGLNTSIKGDPPAEAKKKVSEFTKSFKDEFGCIRCKDLKGGRIACDTLIAFAAETAENIINSDKEY